VCPLVIQSFRLVRGPAESTTSTAASASALTSQTFDMHQHISTFTINSTLYNNKFQWINVPSCFYAVDLAVASTIAKSLFFMMSLISSECNQELEIAAQGVAQCKVSATRVVADAALRRIG